MEDDLDALFAVAKKHIIADRNAKAAAAKLPKRIGGPVAEEPNALFSNPENWHRTRGVAIIHKETETLLGNFSEYIHKTVASCRKLVREAEPISVSAAEYVDGSWYLEASAAPEQRQEWHERRTVVVDLLLPELKLHAPLIELEVHLSYGAMARVELATSTILAGIVGSPTQLVTLPAGTNVLPMMSAECKLKVREELA